jgi:hypothetical protein
VLWLGLAALIVSAVVGAGVLAWPAPRSALEPSLPLPTAAAAPLPNPSHTPSAALPPTASAVSDAQPALLPSATASMAVNLVKPPAAPKRTPVTTPPKPHGPPPPDQRENLFDIRH